MQAIQLLDKCSSIGIDMKFNVWAPLQDAICQISGDATLLDRMHRFRKLLPETRPQTKARFFIFLYNIMPAP